MAESADDELFFGMMSGRKILSLIKLSHSNKLIMKLEKI